MIRSNIYKIAPFITLVSVAHMAVNAACAFLLLSLLNFYDNPLVALLLSSVLLSFYATVPALAISGAFLFIFSMPVTLIAVLNLLPAYRGISFGLTTVALYVGSLPVLLGYNDWMYTPLIAFSLILFSTITLFIAILLTKKTQP